MKESNILRLIRLEAAESGNTLFRNNVGLFQTLDGRYIQTGLQPGSSDLIGWTTKYITEDDLGKTFAIFTAIETKKADFKLPKKLNSHLSNQANFLQKVQQSGGIADFVSSLEGYKKLIK